MSKNFDYSDLEELRKSLGQISADTVLEHVTNDLANRVSKEVTNNTPISKGKLTSGNLKKSWEVEAARKVGNTWESTIKNTAKSDGSDEADPQYYAPYVEFGHRWKKTDKWVAGKFFATKSVKRVSDHIDEVVGKSLMKHIKKAMKGRG